MKIVWALGVRKLDIQIDSKTSVSILKKEDKPEHQHAALVFEFQELKRREWRITVQHIYRKANFAADYMANLGHSLDLGIHFFDSPDVVLQYWLRFDTIGVCTPVLFIIICKASPYTFTKKKKLQNTQNTQNPTKIVFELQP
ncbi:Putative ribonuclease H protein At1g65750 [Linum perenne]